jgi:hypothetical protein
MNSISFEVRYRYSLVSLYLEQHYLKLMSSLKILSIVSFSMLINIQSANAYCSSGFVGTSVAVSCADGAGTSIATCIHNVSGGYSWNHGPCVLNLQAVDDGVLSNAEIISLEKEINSMPISVPLKMLRK